MDLIYEGITTSSAETLLSLAGSRQNGPDLRRDYDLDIFPGYIVLLSSEWTWFTKGLRHDNIPFHVRPCVRMDLIYEGITTPTVLANLIFKPRQNGPDLRRDYDLNPLDRMHTCQGLSEWTWFTKGLRLGGVIPSQDPLRQNGPDLRRDYDFNCSTFKSSSVVRMDLIYEGITTLFVSLSLSTSVRMDLIYEGITTHPLWFCINQEEICQNGPDLRRDYD